MNNKNVIFAIKNCIIPSKDRGSLVMYQRIIAIGFWIIVVTGLLSVVFFCQESNSRLYTLLFEYSVGIVCSMIVVVVTSILQFQKTREELFENFYSDVFLLINLYRLVINSEGIIDKGKVKHNYEEIEKAKDSYDKVALKLFWFSKEKTDAYHKVLESVLLIFAKIYEVNTNKESGVDTLGISKKMKLIIKNMEMLSEKYYPDLLNLFKTFNWD